MRDIFSSSSSPSCSASSSSSSASSNLRQKQKVSESCDSLQEEIDDDIKQIHSQSSLFPSNSNSLDDQEISYLNSSKAIEKLKNPSKRISKKANKQPKSLLSSAKKGQTQLQFEERQALCLFNRQLPSSDTEFFLINDVYIELNKNVNNEIGFERYRALQNELRPITRIKHLKDSGFLVLDFDETKRGLSDFQHIIERLKSLQDKNLYELAESLTIYNHLMSFSKQIDDSMSSYERQAKYTRHKIQLQQYVENTLPEILKPLDKSKFYVYLLYDMTEGFHNQVRKQYGMNEKYIQLFGSNVEELTSMQLRQGWFNLTQYSHRNRQSIEYFMNVKAVYDNSFDFNSVNIDLEYNMVTLENISVPVHVVPQYHFCYSNTDANPLLQGQQLMIGIFYLMEIVLQPHSKKMIRDIRGVKASSVSQGSGGTQQISSPNTKAELPFSNQKYSQIGNQVYSNDLSKKEIHQYHQHAEKFIDTFMESTASSIDNMNNSHNQSNPNSEKTCKFVSIQVKE